METGWLKLHWERLQDERAFSYLFEVFKLVPFSVRIDILLAPWVYIFKAAAIHTICVNTAINSTCDTGLSFVENDLETEKSSIFLSRLKEKKIVLFRTQNKYLKCSPTSTTLHHSPMTQRDSSTLNLTYILTPTAIPKAGETQWCTVVMPEQPWRNKAKEAYKE